MSVQGRRVDRALGCGGGGRGGGGPLQLVLQMASSCPRPTALGCAQVSLLGEGLGGGP